MTANQKFDREFFRELWKLLKPYWVSEEKWIAYFYLLLTTICIVIQVRANVGINEFFKNFFDAVQNFNKPVLIHESIHFVVLFTIAILAFGYGIYFNGLLIIRWRRWLTNNYLKNWLGDHNFYAMQVLQKNVDNPDQRISEDLDSFPSATLSIFFNLLQAVLTLLAFSYILWSLSGSLIIPLWKAHHFTVPGYMFFITLVYAIIGTWLTIVIGKKLPALNYQQQYFNADFRFGLVRVRESSEQISLYMGEKTEDVKLRDLFARIFGNYISIIKVQRNLTFFQNGYDLSSYLLSYLIGIPLYFAKKVQMGGIIQISIAFRQVLSAFSVFIGLYTTLASWRAVIFRLAEFSNHIQEANQTIKDKAIRINYHESPDLVVHDLALSLPNGNTLLDDFAIRINPSDKLLIMGASGSGKSTLLRTFAGIWPYGTGQIEMPKNKKLMFLPQKPYLPLGTLAGALAYPAKETTFSETEYLFVLEISNLQKFKAELYTTHNWSHELSLGEQQLIAFARIFLQKPDWVFLDEATSALDEQLEIKMYDMLYQQLPNLTIVSVGHRSSLQQFHNTKIEIMPGSRNYTIRT